MSEALLTLRRVKKHFGGVQALKPLDFKLRPGDLVGLVGENGAGKSTLIKLISGVHQPDAGEIHWRREAVSFSSPRDALDAGIATIHQELEYLSHLSVAENILLGEEWPRRPWGAVDWNRLHTEARRRLTDFGLDLSTGRLFEDLTSAEKQEVAIATALARNARLLILDEPTASLTEPEVKRLFAHLRRLREQGVAILYVSHRLDEIFAITNRVAVLRDGQLVAAHPTNEVEVNRLIEEMVGRNLQQTSQREMNRTPGEPLLELQEVSRRGMFHNITFQLRAGEVVGLAGLVGAGRSELARAIYGLYPIDRGHMRLKGNPWSPSSPRQALKAGLVYLPEERKRQGLVMDHSVRDSLSVGFSDLASRFGLINGKREAAFVDDAVQKYDVRTSDVSQPVGTLSGGNQQKVMLARWLERDPSVIILDEPTRGVDVGAKAEIHHLIDRLAEQSKAVLLISSDLPEILRLSDRVLVMNRGRIGRELQGDQITEENIVLAASGLDRQPTATATNTS